ncbi:hypothetical protein PHMEG_00013726, partial [Phytophthora megakarya]
QCRSKYLRPMAEYDVYKRLCDLSGAGWCSETNCPTLDEEGWATLTQAQPRNATLYKRFRPEGFTHDTLCAQLAETRATAEDADTVQMFDVSAVLEATKIVKGKDYKPAEGTVARDHAPAPRDSNRGRSSCTGFSGAFFTVIYSAHRSCQALSRRMQEI